jgi:hypothetical protein
MRLTNKFNLPQPILNVASKRQPVTGGIRTTTLISSPKIKVLERQHYEQMEDDVSNSVWAMFGTGFHKLMEDGADALNKPEMTYQATVNGTVVSGTVDLTSHSLLTGEDTIFDYKVTTAWSAMQEKPEWELQLNVYAFLANESGRKVTSINILAVIRDWTAREAKLDSEYPQSPMVVIPIPLWPHDITKDFIAGRITAHVDAGLRHSMGESLPDCDTTERWYRKGKLAVVNNKKSARALKVFEEGEEREAREFRDTSKNKEDLEIHIRSGKSIRCHSFCRVSKFCSQFEEIVKKEVDSILL